MIESSFATLQISQISTYILQINLNRPQACNAINSVMMQDLRQLWLQLGELPANIRCLILTGTGKNFCAGADLKERQEIDLGTWQKQHAIFEQAMIAMIDCPFPIIAAVNGAAFGGGLELALACDFIYAATNAQFAQSEVKLGIMPGAMGTQNLSRACGLRRAKELSFTAKPFSAEQALQWGVANQLCEPEELLPSVIAVAENIAANAPFAVRQVKKSIDLSSYTDLKTGFNFEIEAYNRLLPTQDRIEGIDAFNKKRQPVFTDS